MSDESSLSKISARDGEKPVAALFSPDLLFLVRLQSMAHSAGYAHRAVKSVEDLSSAKVVVVNIAGGGNWEAIIAHAAGLGVAAIAFGPHMDSEGRKRARQAGAGRVLANSNLDRDLPGILSELRDA